jgi:hypothetical protein
MFEKLDVSTVSRHKIVYRCVTPDPAQALFFGGGATGGTVHMPDDSLYLLVSRSDLWNGQGAMGAIGAIRLRGTPGLFSPATTARQECDLARATIRIMLGTALGEVRIRLTCLRNRDIILLDIEDERSRPGAWTVTLENWHPDDETGSVDGHLLQTTHVNRDSCFADRNRLVGVDAVALGIRDPLLGRAWSLTVSAGAAVHAKDSSILLNPSQQHRIVLATACEAPAGKGDRLADVAEKGRALAESSEKNLVAWQREHEAWWSAFWQKSHISLQSGTGEAEYEERLWYVNLYALACGMGGPYPMRFNGGSYLLEKDVRSWDYGYWGQNMRLVYFPMLAAGHVEFVREYIDWYLSNQVFVRAQTRSLFGIDGLTWRETQSFWGADTASSLAEPNEVMHHHFTNNLELCLLMEAYYRITGDEVFLRDSFYPALRGILEFFRQYAKVGADGRYHLAPAGAAEVWPQMIDTQSEVCGLHYFLPKAIAWAGRLGEAAGVIDSWREFASKLPDIPVGRWHVSKCYDQGIHDERWLERSELCADGIYLPAAGQTRERTKRINMENAELYIVFPWGMVNLDSPEADRRRIENTWNHRTWPLQNNGWAQDTVQLARLGWREEFRLALREHTCFTQRFPNGLFTCAASPKFHGMLTDTPYFDSTGVHLTALEEMFLQSYDGILKLAPALPESWSGSCRLQSFDGFVVELKACAGLPVHAWIGSSPQGGVLRVRNHRREPMQAAIANASTVTIEPGGLFERRLTAGDSVELTWEGVVTELPAASEQPDVIWPEYKIRGPFAAYRSGHWHDERKNHGQVGLAADGLFPSTRQPPCLTSR